MAVDDTEFLVGRHIRHPISWDAESQIFSAFISDLPQGHSGRYFVLKSARTGKKETFWMNQTVNRGEDVSHWVYRSPEGHKLHIYNT